MNGWLGGSGSELGVSHSHITCFSMSLYHVFGLSLWKLFCNYCPQVSPSLGNYCPQVRWCLSPLGNFCHQLSEFVSPTFGQNSSNENAAECHAKIYSPLNEELRSYYEFPNHMIVRLRLSSSLNSYSAMLAGNRGPNAYLDMHANS